MSFSWRPLTAPDLPAVEAIAEVVHPDFPEDPAVFAERLSLFPAGCLLLHGPQGPAGYSITHPWHLGRPPALDILIGAIPTDADSFYIHDLALIPDARGTGAGGRAVAQFAALARSEGLPSMSLIAVNGSAPFWESQGFATAPLDATKLASYGEAARYMTRLL
ncbi:GNAT family N-acetyltransferase [Acetobacteraceae bacterium H6797]|nr:GNAT family N-acetyltransferase [Acetobacteraceae bacterium H6797]